MPFDFFLRFQRNYIKNVIKVFDKTLSQLFLVARKKVKHHIEDQMLCDDAGKMRHFCERDISEVYASILLKICDVVVIILIAKELKF